MPILLYLGIKSITIVKWSQALDDHSPWDKLDRKYTQFTEQEKELIEKYLLLQKRKS